MEPHFAAGARRLAFRRRLVGKGTGIDEGDPMMLVVVADKGDMRVLVEQLGPEDRAVPLDHLRTAIGLQHEMRQLLR